MKYSRVLNITDKLLLFAIIGVIIHQLYLTFKTHEVSFESPVEYVKQNFGNDFISQYGKRFTEIKKMFPAPARITYIGETNESMSIGWTNYFLTQYYLAPHLILKANTACDTVLYNLYSSKQINPTTNYHLNNGWHLVKDFNNGLIVLAK